MYSPYKKSKNSLEMTKLCKGKIILNQSKYKKKFREEPYTTDIELLAGFNFL